MIVLRVVLLLIYCILINARYSLYHSDIDKISYQAYDCLHEYYISSYPAESGKFYSLNSQLTPYCRRPDDDDENNNNIKEEKVSYETGENIANIISFNELKKQGVTSEQLLAWSAPIDVVEKYEMNEINSDVFYNCSLPWFGSSCQYKFNHNVSLTFGDIIEATFIWTRYNIRDVMIGTCYRFLPGCNNESWPMCLDWRQICDGFDDCINGEDEQWCDQLEMSECEENEYRCHYGGQCIPLTFDRDDGSHTDCLDSSDVIDRYSNWPDMKWNCWDESIFGCQEVTSRYPYTFQCGDGQFLDGIAIPNYLTYCDNLKDREFARVLLTSMDHIPDMNCRKAFYCALRLREMYELGKRNFS